MVKYEYGKIYKLYSKEQNIIYIGSTAMYYLSQRLAKHISSYKIYLNTKDGYVYSFKVLECEDYKIELLEDYPCANVYQLKTRERYYIENNECVNKNIPTRTKKEYHEANRDKILVRNKEYKQVNKDKIAVQIKEYQEANKDKLEKYYKEYGKKYREANKDKIKAKASELIVCECGCELRRDDIAKHKKTKKHLDLVQNN